MLVAVKNVQHDWCFLIGLLLVKFSLVKCPLVYSLTYDVTPGFKLFTMLNVFYLQAENITIMVLFALGSVQN